MKLLPGSVSYEYHYRKQIQAIRERNELSKQLKRGDYE